MAEGEQPRRRAAGPDAADASDASDAKAHRGRRADWSLSAVAAGFLAALVSFSGPLAIFYQAARAGHMPDAMFASWVWGISTGAGVAGIVLSWRLRAPVITARSAPGTALLIALFPRLPQGEAVGAYLTAAAVLLLAAATGIASMVTLMFSGYAAGGLTAGGTTAPGKTRSGVMAGSRHTF